MGNFVEEGDEVNIGGGNGINNDQRKTSSRCTRGFTSTREPAFKGRHYGQPISPMQKVRVASITTQNVADSAVFCQRLGKLPTCHDNHDGIFQPRWRFPIQGRPRGGDGVLKHSVMYFAH